MQTTQYLRQHRPWDLRYNIRGGCRPAAASGVERIVVVVIAARACWPFGGIFNLVG